jgi:DNA-binding CsgD family transcriptional regulator
MKSGASDPLLDLVGVVHEAALDPRLWPDVAALMSGLFINARVTFGVIDTLLNAAALDVETSSRINQKLFRERYLTAETNPGIRFAATTPSLTIRDREQEVSDRDLVKLEFYNDIMRPAGFWHAITLNIYRDERYLSPLGILRSQSEGPFTDAERRTLRSLAPHLNRAIRVMLRIKESEARADASSEIIDRLSVGVVLTDASGTVAEINRMAGSIIDEADGLMIRDGVLRAANRRDDLRLARYIFEAAGGHTATQLLCPSAVMRLSRPSLRRPLPLVIGPTRHANALIGRSRAVSVMFTDPEQAPEADAALLARLYGLTPREAAVAALLLSGESPAAVAADLAMTMNTVRTHIRHIFEKTEVDRLSEFVRLVLRGPIAGHF